MDREVARVAEQQHGVFTRQQVLALGFTADAIRHRVRRSKWEPFGHEVYRLPGTCRTWEQRLLAAVFAAGPGAAASHRSAAALLKLPASYGRDRRR